jgi:ribosomal protein S18 acetylase RimI-like enzyme
VSSPGTIQIRKAAARDGAEILRCLRDAFEPYRERYTAGGYVDTVLTAETLKQRLETMAVFVATDESGRVVGTIACAPATSDEGHVRGMAVLPECQGAGVAQRLLDAALAELQTRGCTRVTLDTTEPLERAVRFYRRSGFRPSGVVRDFFGMPLFEYVKHLV